MSLANLGNGTKRVSVGQGFWGWIAQKNTLKAAAKGRQHLKLTNLPGAVVLAGLQGGEVVLVATTTRVVEGHAALLVLGEVPLGQLFTAITGLLRKRTAVWDS